ncbi:hypothetical protein BZA70DRAFT_66163 [Myxozyma melibiosi]|uniref:Calcineurin-like phosphoesterase domain-containing protein n=1 Tax=Myxozyma melibiosi TaxID=54550 RepID=A0ABR1F0X4_9ASCO
MSFIERSTVRVEQQRPPALRRRRPLPFYLRHNLCLQIIAVLAFVAAVPLCLYVSRYADWDAEYCSWPPTHERDQDRDLRMLLYGDPQIRGNGPRGHDPDLRTKLDIFGNDHFLGTVYRTLAKQLKPTHIVVLGDLISSQWIDDAEFARRARRFRNRIFEHPLKGAKGAPPVFWNLSGNHDIGYAHEVTDDRARRFEEHYGKLNFAVYADGYRAIVFNAMSIDGDPDDSEYGQSRHTLETREFLKQQMETEFWGTTILFMHVPLHKEAGVCVDDPYFSYYDPDSRRLIREQNMLSPETSSWLLDGFFTDGGHGFVVNGHDHEGCLVNHIKLMNGWVAEPISKGKTTYRHSFSPEPDESVVEITVRSMMGQFGGNVGLLKGFYQENNDDVTKFTFSLCTFGPQHTWWAATITFYLALIAGILSFIVFPLLIINRPPLYTRSRRESSPLLASEISILQSFSAAANRIAKLPAAAETAGARGKLE